MNKLCLSCFYTYDDSAAACPHCGAPGGIPANEAYQLPAGTRLKNRFIIGRVLGSGGFGVTYLAYDEMLRIRCAIARSISSGVSHIKLIFPSKD